LKCFYGKKNICFPQQIEACETLWIFRKIKGLLYCTAPSHMNENPQFIFYATYWDREKFFFPLIQDVWDVKKIRSLPACGLFLLCVAHFFPSRLKFLFRKTFLWFIGALNRLCFIRQNRLNFISTFTFIFLHFKFTNVKFVSYWINEELTRI